MNNELYELIGNEFDRLADVLDPFKDEEHRQRFRAAWLAFLASNNVTEEQWDNELCGRLKAKDLI